MVEGDPDGNAVRAVIRQSLGEFLLSVDLDLPPGLNVLFGPSGSGKTQTLRAIAGLLSPDDGRISIGTSVVFDSTSGVNVPARDRPTGYVPQQLALFPHMTVIENITFGMSRGAQKNELVGELLGLVGLSGFQNRRPSTLSGGQQQRVALVRAIVRGDRLLLLDEPFSALDERLRESLRNQLLQLRERTGITTLFVTHDLREAHLLADTMAVIDQGRILQQALRDVVFRTPRSLRVAELTGVENLLPATVISVEHESVVVDVAGLQLRCGTTAGNVCAGNGVHVGIRAERINLRRHAGDIPANHFMARVTDEWAYGNTHTVRLEPTGPGPSLVVELASRPYEVLGVASQRHWLLELPAEDLHLMAD
jgi:molybdate transport system ATP-binding protein